MPTPPTGLTHAPGPLREALAERGAEVEDAWREYTRAYAFATAADGSRLFARYGLDGSHDAVFEHEAQVRERVGREPPLRSPAVLASGQGWMLEQAVDALPLAGEELVESAVRAAGCLSRSDLPSGPWAAPPAGRAAWRRRLGVVLSPQRVREALLARRSLRGLSLPLVTSHGDFHTGNILGAADGGVWIVDWELCGHRFAGWDLMQLWPMLSDPADRERVWEGAVELVGPQHASELRRLRTALLVRTIRGREDWEGTEETPTGPSSHELRGVLRELQG